MKSTRVALFVALASAAFCLLRAEMQIGMNLYPVGWGKWVPERGGTGSDAFAGGRENITGKDPIWKAEFLEESRIYKVLRFMDWCLVVNTSRSGKWADRAKPTDPKAWHPVAFEHMIDLCNRLKCDMWVNVVHTADADYERQLATLIKAQLHPSLKCYIEWSNELWNYAQSQGGHLGGIDGRAQGTVDASVKMFKIFEEVYGTEMSTRVVRVIPGWTDEGYTRNILGRFKATNAKADAYAIAPYVGGDVSASPGCFPTLYQKLASVAAQCRADKAEADKMGLRFVAYEGGVHMTTGAFVETNRAPAMYDFYKAYNDTMAHYFSVFAHYANAHNYGDWAWGVKEYIGQPMSTAHKYRALYDWIQEHPIASAVRNRAGIERPLCLQSGSRAYDVLGRIMSKQAMRRSKQSRRSVVVTRPLSGKTGIRVAM